MNPFEVKIWIGGWRVCHPSTAEECSGIVPSDVSPWPLKRRNTCAFGADAVGVLAAGVEAPVGAAGLAPVCGGELDAGLPAVVFFELGVVPVAALVAVLAGAEDALELLELSPQPASRTRATGSASTAAAARESLRRRKFMGHLPPRKAYWTRRSEITGSRGSSRARAPV